MKNGTRWGIGAACALLLGCSSDDKGGGKTVGVGVNIDRTGSIARPAWHEAAKLAILHANEGINEYGGFRKLKFSYHGADSTNTPDVARQRALELVHDEGVKMLISDTSADNLAVNGINYDDDPTNDLLVPIVCQACTSGAIGNPNATNADPVTQASARDVDEWNFRSTMVSRPQGVVLRNIASAMTGYGAGFKISVYNIDDAYGDGFFNDILAAVNPTSSGIIIEQVEHPRDVDASSYDWASDAALLADDETNGVTDKVPDLVIIVDFPQYAAAITGAYVTGGYLPRILQTHNFRHDSVIAALGDDVNGQEGTSHAILDNGASGTNFNTALEDYWGQPAGFWDANTYDAAMTMMLATAVAVYENALEDANEVTGTQIRDAMYMINDTAAGVVIGSGPDDFALALGTIEAGGTINYEGPSGPMNFDAYGNVRGKIARYVYQSGAFQDQDLYDCVSDIANCPLLP